MPDETDRDALPLRFFQRAKLAELGSALGIGEEAARKRVDRSLERLRNVLTRRGIRSTSSALGALKMNYSKDPGVCSPRIRRSKPGPVSNRCRGRDGVLALVGQSSD
ncbi:MAG: sigma factor-like helix-turn-helix DNA-binding protein [Limisphaerales bacterium]